MKNQLEFIKDEKQNCITVIRTFNAPVDKVWRAWTEPALLDQWWAPRPWMTKTKTMDFREGGFWLYSMQGPEGEEHFCRADYKKIDTGKSYNALDAFCDENGTPTEFPNMNWTNTFTPNADGSSTVNILIQYKDAESMQKVIEMGFKEGFSAAIDNLDELLESTASSK